MSSIESLIEWAHGVKVIDVGSLTAYEAICEIAFSVGLTIVDKPFLFDSDNLPIQYSNGKAFGPDIRLAAHELGHFLVAPIDRRYVENYGLGGDPEFGGESDNLGENLLSSSDLIMEENRADAIGGMLVLYLGGIDAFKYYIDMHSWGDGMVHIINYMVIEGFFDSDRIPMVLSGWLNTRDVRVA